MIITVLFLGLFIGRMTADAADLVAGAQKISVSKATLVKKGNHTRLLLDNGKYVKDKWVSYDGDVYAFGKKGNAYTGWFKKNKNWYFADKNGKVYHRRWLKKGKNAWFLRKDGTRASKVTVKLGGKYYFFNKNGKLVKNKMYKVNGNYYYSNADGVQVRQEWVTIGDYTYYFNSKGIRTIKRSVDTAEKTDKKYIFVGDSRTVGMSMSVSTSDTLFIGKISTGLTWLEASASSQVRDLLNTYGPLKVVFGFGINDLANIDHYISYYKQLIDDYPDSTFYFMSVNPISHGNAYVNDSGIKSFNTKLKKAFGKRYIDTYSYLVKNGYSTFDGIHYMPETYQKIYNFVISKIG